MARVDAKARKAQSERRRLLRRWFRQNGRSFPWRNTPNRWGVFIAEVLLRRTRAPQVARMYEGVLDAFPEPAFLAQAKIEEVEDVIRSAGMVRRAHDLHEAAQILVACHGGRVPDSEAALLCLPGVGPYVAGATIASTTRRRTLLVDTNTVRVSLRAAGRTIDAVDVRRQKVVVESVRDLFGGSATGRDWWAVIDLAASICKPGEPLCAKCPIMACCRTGIASGDASNGSAYV